MTGSTTDLTSVLAGVVGRWPGRVAVSDGVRSVSYAELDAASDRWARGLRAAGAGPGTLVGLCLDRGADLIVAMVAVLKTGAGYVPLDPGYPEDRLRYTVADARTVLVVGEERLRSTFASDGGVFVTLAELAEADTATGSETVEVSGESVAYVIYTSGSTGRPKGVAVSHHSVARLFTTSDPLFSFSQDDVWSMFHSAAFDFSVWEIYGALLHGGRVHVVPYATTRDPQAMWQLITDEGVTMLSQTPTAFTHLIQAARQAGFPPTRLRSIVFGGEALQTATLRPWTDAYGLDEPSLVNMYGITETTVHVTHHPLTAQDLESSSSPIGTPLPDLEIHLLDAHTLEPVPTGETGEMCVGGPGVAHGYLGRPDLTASRFIPHPTTPGARLYRSGDLAHRTADGRLHYHGRNDHQVKLRGFRIELGEIERTLLAHPDVDTATVVLDTRDPGHPQLAAYLTPESADLDALHRHLTGRLPSHMVPATLTPLVALPLTPNGKLDPTQLPAPRTRQQQAAPAVAAAATAVLSPAESALRAVWAKVLGQEDIGAEDNFFSLGGDSITAIRLVSQARAAGIDFGVEDLFLNPTLGELAAAVGATEPEAEPEADEVLPVPVALPAGLPADAEDAYPLAALQLGMLYHVELSGDPTLYHDLTSVRVHAGWSPESLRHALDVLTARHEILRTSFELAEYDEPLQIVHRSGSVRIPVEVEDLSGYGPQEQDKALAHWWERESATAFDLARAPLVRVHVGLRSADSFSLSVSVHHVLLDGWSFARLMTELLDVYEDHLTGGSGRELPPLPAVRYRDFVAAEQAVAASPAARAYWARLLDGVRPLALPAPTGADGAPTLSVLPAGLADGARRVADRLGVPVKSVYLAAHLWALGELAGESDVVSGLCGNGRAESEGSELVLGVFLNVVPVRVAVGGGDWAALVRAAFDAEREHLPYRGYPLSRISKDLGFEPFPVMFNYTDFHTVEAVSAVGALRADDWQYADRTNFPVLVEVNKLAAGLGTELSVTVDPQEASAAVGPRLAELLRTALTDITRALA